MTTEEKPEKLRKPGWENYQRFGWLLRAVRQKTSEKTHRSVKNHWTQKTTGYDQKHAKRTGSNRIFYYVNH
jgi:hypothetical protein